MSTVEKKNKVGRPIEKANRKKIGLSIDGETNNILNELSKKTGKTKSKLFEEAIRVLSKREEHIEARMQKILMEDEGGILDLDNILDEADEIENSKEKTKNKKVS